MADEPQQCLTALQGGNSNSKHYQNIQMNNSLTHTRCPNKSHQLNDLPALDLMRHLWFGHKAARQKPPEFVG